MPDNHSRVIERNVQILESILTNQRSRLEFLRLLFHIWTGDGVVGRCLSTPADKMLLAGDNISIAVSTGGPGICVCLPTDS